jgi:hypothetical protein
VKSLDQPNSTIVIRIRTDGIGPESRPPAP